MNKIKKCHCFIYIKLIIFIMVKILIQFNEGKKSLSVFFKVGMHEKIKF